MKVSVIILNYNGRQLLEECLPSIVNAAKKSRHDCKVVVLDNHSTDESISFLKGNFPSLEVIKASKNNFYFSYNEFIGKLSDDIVIIINNDIKVDAGYIDPLIEPFLHNNDILFTAARGYSFDGRAYEGDKAKAVVRWGVIEPAVTFKGYSGKINVKSHTLSAGIGAFDRKKFLELGGYDDIYAPGRYEDVDLCYRGWKKGYRGIYQPESIQYHKGGASFNKEYGARQISKTVFRNSIIFMMKNVTDPFLLLRFFALTTLRSVIYMFMGKFYMTAGYLSAFKKLPLIMRKRRANRLLFILSDREILNKVNKDI